MKLSVSLPERGLQLRHRGRVHLLRQPANRTTRTRFLNKSYFQELAELFGDTAGDPGHWNYAPEWFGTQGGGWGRDTGSIVFYGQSEVGNGLVTVTSHPTTPWGDSPAQELQEWRVLRFNQDTRQSVNRVLVTPDGTKSGAARVMPECLAWPYLKVMAAAGAAALNMHPSVYEAAVTRPQAGALPTDAPHIVCIGLGGGSLPACLAHHFPGARVTAVELDPLVVEAARKGMGLGADGLHNLEIVEGDAADHMRQLAAEAPGTVAQVYIDAFDGEDRVPPQLCTPGEPFMAHLAAALHPTQGAVLINLHSEGSKDLPPADKTKILMGLEPDRGYNPALPLGAQIVRVGGGFQDALLAGPSPAGCAFTAADRYGGGNVTAVVVRGAQLPGNFKSAAEFVQKAAAAGGQRAGFVFPAEKYLAKTAPL